MILELFGPSGAGKTTLACELVHVLRAQGYSVVLQTGDRRHPVRRAAFKLVSGLHSKWIGQRSLGAEVLKILPPKNELWAARLNWHLEALLQAWRAAIASKDTISIFDQGMVQFVCSLVLFSGITDRERVSCALELLPKPDLLVRLQAPREILEARLRERRRNLGIIQKFLEVDLQSSLDHIDHVNLIEEQLGSFPVPTTCVESLDSDGLAAATEIIARGVIDKFGAARAKFKRVEA
ncbi:MULTISPECIES: AAA family ATPase [unclassified Mesorhizobium]|uniref:AAA family ATPase n=1 Tax=unclassified Mesorhizobium TaxID=325217 RepID=UPI0003CECB61|nr:AAA family ATPase [Mesorhizobium sp. LSHC420B00]ESX80540.1 hypothetical protein X759_11475 [Mesorhizobium sp. LSHC420B00]